MKDGLFNIVLFLTGVIALALGLGDQLLPFMGLVVAMSLIWTLLLAPLALAEWAFASLSTPAPRPSAQEFAWFVEG